MSAAQERVRLPAAAEAQGFRCIWSAEQRSTPRTQLFRQSTHPPHPIPAPRPAPAGCIKDQYSWEAWETIGPVKLSKKCQQEWKDFGFGASEECQKC